MNMKYYSMTFHSAHHFSFLPFFSFLLLFLSADLALKGHQVPSLCAYSPFYTHRFHGRETEDEYHELRCLFVWLACS
ncbi:hypothetical protein J3F83DRAFT_739187 [Trichoderma novae-zelandiae]